MTTAVYSTSSLKEQNAQTYKSMAGKVHAPLLKSLDSMGYEYMTPVQQKCLTELPTLQSDCLVQAKTGTGKTIAFLLPALHTLLTEQTVPAGNVGILIISPTRELATQIAKECDQLTSQLQTRLECHTAFGGTKKDQHLKAFLHGKPTVLVATPGRLNDYLSDDFVAEKFRHLRTLVLDEADTMLEAGFLPDITRIIGRLPAKKAGWQGMCFSATMPEKIKGVLGRVLKPDYTHLTTVNANETPTIDLVTQYSAVIPTVSDTFSSLYSLLEHERQQTSGPFKAIVFATTANGVALLHELFEHLFARNVKVFQLQSRLSQSARTKTTEEFKKVDSGLMLASDVIGRGMDFPGVGVVIQVGLPSSGEQYVHRVGRTARAGNDGRAVILLTEREKYFLHVNKQLPIQPYPYDISAVAKETTPAVQQSLASVDDKTKSKAYSAYLGFHKTLLKNLRLDAAGLVALANEYAAAMGCTETPMIDKRTVGKMGLKGTRGLNVGDLDASGPSRNRKPPPKNHAGSGAPGNAPSGAANTYAGRMALNGNPGRPQMNGNPGRPQTRRMSNSTKGPGAPQMGDGSGRGGGVQKNRGGTGPGRKGGRSKAHQGPPGNVE